MAARNKLLSELICRDADAVITDSISKRNDAEPAVASNILKLKKPIPKDVLEVKGLMEAIDDAAGMSKKPNSRRRALNKINDNPLLRPLDGKTHNQILASLAGDSEIIQRRGPLRPKAQIKGKSLSIPKFKEDQSSAFDSEGLSDFVVNDSSSLEEGSSDSDFQTPPRRSIRRLVRGVKKRSSDSLVEVGEVKPTRKDKSHDEAKLPITVVSERELHSDGINSNLPEINEKNPIGSVIRAGRQESQVLLSGDRVISSRLEQPFTLLKP